MILLVIAEAGGIDDGVRITTGEIGSQLSISQQTASRHLGIMTNDGLIIRVHNKNYSSYLYKLTDEGKDALKSLGNRIIKALKVK